MKSSLEKEEDAAVPGFKLVQHRSRHEYLLLLLFVLAPLQKKPRHLNYYFNKSNKKKHKKKRKRVHIFQEEQYLVINNFDSK